MSDTTPPFWERPLDTLDQDEWEALCDGCGKCCIHKVEDELSGEFHATNVACRLLDRHNARCMDYPGRKALVPDCIRLTPSKIRKLAWLPRTCAYRLRSEGKPLFDWHYLVSGDRETVHRAGMSVRGWTVSEDESGDLEHHLIDREL
jgi:uncharacterized cysteine cluster protein YcgN (CxxCxxCC family)